MRNRGMGEQHRRRIGADAEERGAGKIEHARIAELQIEPQSGHRIEQDPVQEQQHEMIVVEPGGDGECAENCQRAQRILAFGEAAADALQQPEPLRRQHGQDGQRQQRDDDVLPLGREQSDHIDGDKRQRGQTRQQRRSGFLSGHAIRLAR